MMFDLSFGQRLVGLCSYMDNKTQHYVNKGETFTRGYLEGAGRLWVFLARYGLPGTTKTTHINCALEALEKLTKN
jgi:hypothetical protein